MYRSMPTATALLAVLAPAASALAAAAPAAAEFTQVSTVSSVVVTAAPHHPDTVSLSKLPDDPRDIAQSITVLDKGLLESQGATSLADALRNVPGITLGGAEGGQIGNNINLNGFTARTDIYLDGFRDRGQYYRDTFALQSVEVLMGPSSMLFGRGSTGGAINQVSKKASLTPALEVALSYTSNGLARGTADFNQPLSEHAALRISMMGQVGAPTTRDHMDVKDFGIAPTLELGIGTPTEVTVSALVQHNDDRPDYGVSPLNGHPVNVDRNAVYGYSDDHTTQDVVSVSATIKHEVSSHLSLRDQVQYNSVDTNARETASNTIGTVNASGFHVLTPSATSALPLDQLSVRLQSHDRKIHDTSLFNQAEATARFDTGFVGHTLLVGTEFGHDHYRNQNYFRPGTCNGVALNAANSTTGYVACEPLLDPQYDVSPSNAPSQRGNLAGGSADTAAVYANDTLQLGKYFKLAGGLRYDRYDATITNSVNALNTAGNTTLASAHQVVNFTSVRAGAIWQPSHAQSYYVSYSTSFDPSLEQLTSTTGISQPLPPETNRAYEVGGKWEFIDDRLNLTAAAFQITQDNSRSQNADNTYTANGTVRVRGERVGVTGTITDAWRVFGGYTHLDARIIAAIAPGTLGKVPTNTPEDSATLWSTYTVAKRWELGGGFVYMGQRFANNTDLTQVGAYTRWDATIAYHQPRYDIRLNLFNLFDTRYYDALIQSDGGRSVPGTGRTAMLSLVYRQ